MSPLIDRVIGPAIGRYLQRLSGSDGTLSTNAGVSVGASSFFELVAMRSAINVLAQDVATLPLKLYRKRDRARYEVRDHPLSECLKTTPNPRMTAYELREMMMVSLLTWGNAYAYLQRDNQGRVTQIWPLRPDNMAVDLTPEGQLLYTYTPSNIQIEAATFTSSEILHAKGLSSDGLIGRSPLTDFRQKLGEVGAAERFTQAFFGNGMKRSGVLRHKEKLSPEAFRNLKQSVSDLKGPDKSFSVLILEEGMEFDELTFAPEDAQLLETRRFSVEDACRIFNLPPYKLRINTPGAVSYASVDAQAVDYLVSSLTPWLVRLEQSIDRACLSPAERKEGLFVEHNTRALLRSDLKSQAEALEIGRKNGWYSVNDCREHLGENPVRDARADDYFAPTFIQSTSSTMPGDMPVQMSKQMQGEPADSTAPVGTTENRA